MKVTPLELKKADFKRGFRGYSKDEVQNLLASASETLEELIKENMELKQQQIKLSERLKNFEDVEKTINETLIMAQKTSASARQSAEREAELTIAKAEVQAERILEDTRAELNALKRELEMLGHEKNAFLVKMRSLVASQWKLLQEEKISEPVVAETEEAAQPEEEPAREEAEEAGVMEEKLEEAQAKEPEEVAAEPEEAEEAEKLPEGDFSKKLGEILKSDTEETEQETAEEIEPQPEEEEKEEKLLWEEEQGAEEQEQTEGVQKEEDKEKPDVFWGDDEDTEGESDEEDESEKGSNNEK